jgi:hypothetical protein
MLHRNQTRFRRTHLTERQIVRTGGHLLPVPANLAKQQILADCETLRICMSPKKIHARGEAMLIRTFSCHPLGETLRFREMAHGFDRTG